MSITVEKSHQSGTLSEVPLPSCYSLLSFPGRPPSAEGESLPSFQSSLYSVLTFPLENETDLASSNYYTKVLHSSF